MDYPTVSEEHGVPERVVELLQSGPASRHALCTRLGVSRPVLGRALAPLLLDGTVLARSAGADVPRRRGRPAEVLSLAGDVAYAIGLDVSRSRASGVVLDRLGEVMARSVIPVTQVADPLRPLARLCQELDGEVRRRGLRTAYLAQIGVGLPVPVGHETWRRRHEEGSLVNQIHRLLSGHWSAPVLVDSSVRVAALGEARWGAGRHAPSQLYVRVSTGVGGCVAVSNTLTDGDTGYAGELGHVRVPGHDAPCQCGKRGCLETVASVPAVCAASGATDLPRLVGALEDPDHPGHGRALRAVEEAAGATGQVCATIVLALSPSMVVLGGELGILPAFTDAVRRHLEAELVPGLGWRVDVVPAALQDEACARGAAAAAASYFASRKVAEHLQEPW